MFDKVVALDGTENVAEDFNALTCNGARLEHVVCEFVSLGAAK